MTDPVILLGTQSNGETLPVQVDGFGRLVAEGLQGSEGPPGDQGPPGADGGSFPLPPDPYEGALLGWLNNELAWIGSPPVPIPPGVFGPITGWNAQDGLLTVEGEIPAVGSGVYVWQCNQDGTYFTEGWNTSQVWSDDLPAAQAPTAPLAFDGDIGTKAYGPQGGSFTWNNTNGVSGSKWRMYIYVGISTTVTNTYQADSGTVYNGWTEKEGWSSGLYAWVTIADAPVTPTSITITATASNGNPYLAAIEVDDKILVDNDLSLNLRVNSVLGQSLLGIPSATVDFTIGKYLRVPEQRVAPWVLYGNDPTSLIDHLRSS